MKRDEQNERFDLSALDPFTDPRHADALVEGVLERSALELARRRRAALSGERPPSVFAVLAGWARPALAAAVVTLVVSGVALQQSRGEATAQTGVVEALGLPDPVDNWIVEERAPATADLIAAVEEGETW